MALIKLRRSDLKTASIAASICLAYAYTSGPAAAPAVPPDAVLADEPLYATTSLVKPNMVLDLSVEYPTTGAAYRMAFDIRKTYIGYWDPMGCYDYSATDGFFKRAATATVSSGAIVCSNKWSGNVLNWAASSAIDMLRYAMTGGDRIVDTAGSTVLQRAVLQPGFYNNASNFPARTLTGNLGKLTPLVSSGVATDGGTVWIASCRDRFFVGPSSTGTCDQPGANQRFGPGKSAAPYYARVEVCSATEGPLRSDLCLKYPNGKYKPVGTIQTYSDKMRFAAFGYLMDNTNRRYGGVLRAPMKFAGPTAQNARFEKIANEAAEWDENTGVFAANPLSSAENRSGVVNYLNQFGRTGSTPGSYKSLDPVGEMYYESLRYLQGQPPTEQASAGITDAMKDGFPVYNKTAKWGLGTQGNWDPVVASCQRNHVVVIGDLNTHHDRSLPGLATDGLDGWGGVHPVGASEPDTAFWSRVIGAFENNESLAYDDPAGGGKTLTTRGNAGGPQAYAYGNGNGALITSSNIATLNTGSDQGGFGWAGLAYWANTQGIRRDYPDVRVKTYTIDVDEGGDGTIRQGKRGSAFYLAAKYGGFDDKNNDGNPFVTGTGAAESISNSEWQSGLDDDGKPKPANYFLASKPEEMIAAIRKIFANAGAASGSLAGGAVSSTRVTSNGASIYVPHLDSTRWSGSLLAYGLSYDAKAGVVNKDATPTWDAGALLTSGDPRKTPAIPAPDPAKRKVFTMLGSGFGEAFTWDALKGDPALAGYLDSEPLSQVGAKDGLGDFRVAYLRGDRRKETSESGGIFRTRDSVMGDVVNSAPLLVGPPSPAVQGSGYDSFVAARKGRMPAVYVGANDGMLHAFAAASGTELFAYVPRALYPKLGAYTSPAYLHQPYVDGSPAAGEIQLADGTWKTALVSGMGGGARGVFALDVTDPAEFSKSHVMWEFTGADDADMGFVTQAPSIRKFRTVAAKSGQPAVYRWFAVVPSGFNNGNATKAAALFLLSLDKAPGEPWKRNSNYYKIVLPNPLDSTSVNALGPVGDYVSADDAVRWLYAGDTQGNVWKFDFYSNDAPWSEATALGLEGSPLMVAQDSLGNRQPITVAPEVGVGPAGGAIVLFGTGKFVEMDDLSSRRTQSLYAVYDNGKAGIPAYETRTQLEVRKVEPDGKGRFSISGGAFVYGNYDSKTSRRRGWYFDLPESTSNGERLVGDMTLSDGYLTFNTLIPNPNACGTGGGGHSCAVNAMTGMSAAGTCVASTIGLLSSPLVIQGGDSVFSSTDSFGRRIETKKVSIINVGTGTGTGAGVSTAEPIEGGEVSQIAGRLNWRQVINYKDAKP